MAVEHEVKLPFSTIEAARHAVNAAGGRLVVSRRLLDDSLYDTLDRTLSGAGTALRIRRDGSRGVLTWKGRVQPGLVKSREELETPVDDADQLEAIVSALGYHRVFRAQKYREEYELDGATLTVDETPFGVFVEIEATPAGIPGLAARLGRSPEDFVLSSYPSLWRHWCDAQGWAPRDMLFPPVP